MAHGPVLILILVLGIIFIVVATARFKLHPFLALLVASYGIGFAAGLPPLKIGETITGGFGGILTSIGIVIILGTIIGVVLEKSGAAVTMADSVLKVVGERRPGIAMSIIGYIVSIPVFCDSGFVILSALRKSLTRRAGVSGVMMSVALATGLYATHTLVPPTPGPIAAAGNLGLSDNLGLVILVGAIIAIPAAIAGYVWAIIAGRRYRCGDDAAAAADCAATEGEVDAAAAAESYEELKARYGRLPRARTAFAPIILPIVLIGLGSLAAFPTHPLGQGWFFQAASFTGVPVNALFIGFLASLVLFPKFDEETLSGWVGQGLKDAAVIIMITGAGGSLGAVLKATPIGAYLGQTLAQYHAGIFLPFIIAAALKTAQGSSTVSLVTTSALVMPLLPDLGLASVMGRVLTVMAIAAGSMTVSHANDSYFWVVAEFSGMDVATAYRSQTVATLIQGITTIIIVAILTAILV
ncbi:MAG: GntP family permease [bacterium]|nr:GntP family permease [bacterium]